MSNTPSSISPTKRKRLLKTFGSYPQGWTSEDLERFLNVLYSMFSHLYTIPELRQIQISDPFDRSETPRQLTVIEFADWLEALLA